MLSRALLLILALLGGTPSLALAVYESLYVLGDSLSDNGNAFILSGGVFPPNPPYAERFSNGPATAELLAAQLGVPSVPSALGGTNYAVGGATTGTENFSFEVQPGVPAALDNTGMLVQLGSFLGSGPSVDPATSLFMVWGGPNDFFLAFERGDDLVSTIGTAVNNIATVVFTLAELGVTDILVPNMPNLAVTPFGQAQTPEAQAALAAISAAFNTLLSQALADLQLATMINLMEFDIARLLQDVIDDPAAFGFDNVTGQCLAFADPGSVPGCEGFLFFDGVHPATFTHQLVADRLFARVTAASVPEPSNLALTVLALLAATMASSAAPRRRRERDAAIGPFAESSRGRAPPPRRAARGPMKRPAALFGAAKPAG